MTGNVFIKLSNIKFHVNIFIDSLDQRFPTFLTRGALFIINFYGGAP